MLCTVYNFLYIIKNIQLQQKGQGGRVYFYLFFLQIIRDPKGWRGGVISLFFCVFFFLCVLFKYLQTLWLVTDGGRRLTMGGLKKRCSPPTWARVTWARGPTTISTNLSPDDASRRYHHLEHGLRVVDFLMVVFEIE